MAATDTSQVVVTDAGPLIHLDELGVVDLLNDFSEVCIPEAVWREVQQHRPGACGKLDPLRMRLLGPVPEVSVRLRHWAKVLALGRGEVEALHWMEAMAGAIFLTDDAAARLAAAELGHMVHGTIGILLRAVRRRRLPITRVEELIRGIHEHSTLHLRQDLLEQILRGLQLFDRDP